MGKKTIRVGLDFDGVVAYNPFRVCRAPLAFFKRNILGAKKLNFWYPKEKWQQIFWKILHESSVFPAKGVDLLRKLVEEEKIEAHLITGRYSFLDNHLYNWLDKHRLRRLFKTININKNDEQPHVFKERIIKKYELEIFVEDNWDIVEYLTQNSKLKDKDSKIKIYWIYNLVDRNTPYKYKSPYLQKALEEIMRTFDL